MHELGIMTSVLDAVCESAQQADANKVLKVSLSIGEMTEAVEDALVFAFEALRDLSEYRLCAEAELCLNFIRPKSICLDCGTEFEHDKFHAFCPECESSATSLTQGRELQIDSIEVDI